MADFNAAVTELKAGKCVRRGLHRNQNGAYTLFLKTNGKRKFLFAGGVPGGFDWDDIIATDWQVVDGTYRDYQNQHQAHLEGIRLRVEERNRTPAQNGRVTPPTQCSR